MRPEFMAEQLIDISNDANFEKLASFANMFTVEESQTDIGQLIEKQAYAEDATFADDIGRMFSIASPLETKISALYAQKCASILTEEVVTRINDACNIYGLDLQVPVINKTASIMEDAAIMAAIDEFDREYVDKTAAVEDEDFNMNKYAGCTEYGNQLDTCLAARAMFAREPEEIEAIETLAKIASRVAPSDMVNYIAEIDSELGLDTPQMQRQLGTPEYAVYEKVASENMVTLTKDCTVPLSVISEYADNIKDMGVELDWDGESGDALQLQIEALPAQVKGEIASWVK